MIKRHFSSKKNFPVCIENIFGTILNILECHYHILKKKYLFIKMSFYPFIKIWCSKMSSVTVVCISPKTDILKHRQFKTSFNLEKFCI